MYIPIHSLLGGELLTFKSGYRDFRYQLRFPMFESISTYRLTNKFTVFCKGLIDNNFNEWFHIKDSTLLASRYFLSAGLLLSYNLVNRDKIDISILACLAVKKEELFKLNRNSLKLDQLCFIVNNDLIDNEDHSKVYRNIKRLCLDKISSEVDILYTNNINNTILKPIKLPTPKFSNISDLLNHNKSMNEILVNEILSS
jgi:hypothetical protein